MLEDLRAAKKSRQASPPIRNSPNSRTGEIRRTVVPKWRGCADRFPRMAACFFKLFLEESRHQQRLFRYFVNEWIDFTKNHDSNQQSDHSKASAPQPVQITPSGRIVHEDHDGGAAVQRWRREQVEQP